MPVNRLNGFSMIPKFSLITLLTFYSWSFTTQPGNLPVHHRFIFFQSDGLYDRLTPRQHIRFWRKLYDHLVTEEDVLALCELLQVADKRMKRLTVSEQRRVHYARCLVMPSDICVFDQPLLHVDRQTKHVFHALLEQLSDRFVIVTTTSLEEAIQLGQPHRLSERGLERLNDDEDAQVGGQERAAPFTIKKISAKVEDKYILFDPLEIDYVESLEGQLWLYVNGEAFVTTLSLKEMEQRLQPFGFFRCHRSYLVNLQRVREMIVWSKNSYSLKLNDSKKSTVPLSKGNYPILKDMLDI